MFGILFVESFTGDYEDFVTCWRMADEQNAETTEEAEG